ncbi:hypothetical protein D3C85_1731370 [compost metagenome]
MAHGVFLCGIVEEVRPLQIGLVARKRSHDGKFGNKNGAVTLATHPVLGNL